MKTKKIRIALAMTTDGTDWSAQGYSFKGQQVADRTLLNSCEECMDSQASVLRIIEVEVTLPDDEVEVIRDISV